MSKTGPNAGWSRVALEWGDMAVLERAGSGAVLLFLHGAGCDAGDWRRVFAAVPPDLQLVAPEFRGHGRSAVPESGFTLPDLAADVLALTRVRGWERFWLVGHSLGGMVAMTLAQRSTRVRGLILLEAWTRLAAATAFRGTRFYGGLDADTIARLRRRSERTRTRFPAGVWREFWDSVAAFDAEPFLCTAQIPIVQVYGARGRTGTTREKLLVPANPRIRWEWIADAGHYLPIECAAQVARVCAAALAADRDAQK